MTNSSNFLFSWKVFITLIYEWTLNLVNYSGFPVFLLGFGLFLFSNLACRVSVEKSAVSLMLYVLTMIWCFCLAYFRLFYLCFVFESLIIMCHGVDHFWSCLFGVLCASCIWMCISFSKLEKQPCYFTDWVSFLSHSFFAMPSGSLKTIFVHLMAPLHPKHYYQLF